jgi:hypothetical protein
MYPVDLRGLLDDDGGFDTDLVGGSTTCIWTISRTF